MNLQKAEGMKPAGWAMREHKEQKNKIKGGGHPTPPGIEQEDWKKQLELNLKNLIAQGKGSSPTNVPAEPQPSVMPQVQQTVEQQAAPKARRVKEKPKEPDSFQRFAAHLTAGRHDKAQEVLQQEQGKRGFAEYQDALKAAWDKNDIPEINRISAEYKQRYFPEKPKPVVAPKEPYKQKQTKEEIPMILGLRHGKVTRTPDPNARIAAIIREREASASSEKDVPEFPDENTGKPEPAPVEQPAPPPAPQMPENPEKVWKDFGKEVQNTLAAFHGDVEKVGHFYRYVASKGKDRFMNHVIPPADTIDFLLDRASKV